MAEAVAATPQFTALMLARQAGVLVAVAASVALGLYVVLWARTPDYAVLYTDLTERDLSQVVDALQSNEIPYRMDTGSGAILVAADKVHDARLKLAGAGLPRSAGMGFEMLEQEQGFGTSQFIEQARYQRAIEGELSRSISRVNNVRSARVHLAMPKQTAFSRSRRDPTASVIVDLYNGRRLEAHQVAAIVHLVSASVPSLSPDDVTVIDQNGNLLTGNRVGNDELVVSAQRFEYTQRLEQAYIERVEAILMPLVGPDGVRAQVTADLDFTATEHTEERFNPDLPSVRSESLLEEERPAGSGPGGIPGALSNEPPGVATAPEVPPEVQYGPDGLPLENQTAASSASNRRSQTTRNYELDRTISHTRGSVGSIRRLSVAVVVRERAGAAPAGAGGEAGEGETAATGGLSPAEIERMKNLVKEAIGFDAARGDSVSVTPAEFLAPATPEPLPEPPIWEQPWVWSVAKQALGGLFALFILFGIIRPTVRNLMTRPVQYTTTSQAGAADGDTPQLPGAGQAALPPGQQAGGAPLSLASEVSPDLGQVKQFVAQEPKVAAQVIRGWVAGS